MIASIFAFFKSLATLLGFIKEYAPPKSTEQKVEEGEQVIDKRISKEENGDRPKW